MRITFPIRTLGGTAIPESTDNPVLIPPTLQAITLFPGPIAALNPVAQTIQTASFLNSTQHDQPPSTASFSIGLGTFGAGLWEVSLMLRVNADYNQPPITAAPFQFFIQNPALNTTVCLVSTAAVIGVSTVYYKETFNFSQDGWNFAVQSPATVAAQNYEFLASLYGKRLA